MSLFQVTNYPIHNQWRTAMNWALFSQIERICACSYGEEGKPIQLQKKMLRTSFNEHPMYKYKEIRSDPQLKESICSDVFQESNLLFCIVFSFVRVCCFMKRNKSFINVESCSVRFFVMNCTREGVAGVSNSSVTTPTTPRRVRIFFRGLLKF